MKMKSQIYLDCNATTPLEPSVASLVMEYLVDEFGNSGSRTHEYGTRAKKAVQKAREQVASLVDAQLDEIVFTSGATESNNLSILGLADYGRRTGRMHIISTQIEHKAVLEPLNLLETQGFNVTLLPVAENGAVCPEALQKTLTPETLLISVMHVNNETGVIQPIDQIADILSTHDAFFHVDAAQSFGKSVRSLHNKRIDLISASAHKIYGPKGVGALIMRRRDYDLPPLKPLMVGGGQERGLRPGTLPVPLIVGLGEAARLAQADHVKRDRLCAQHKQAALKAFESLKFKINGDAENAISHTLNISVDGVDSEAAILCLKDLVAISNGSACTSASYTPSHVLKAMGFPNDRIQSAIRLSWCHLTGEIPWDEMAERISVMQQ
jgi:cysteine desulfurase